MSHITPCPDCGCPDPGESNCVQLKVAVEGLRTLVSEARAMVPHADEPSGRRSDWCARAAAIMEANE